MKIYTLKVDRKRVETDDTVTLCFKQPGLKKIKYLAGQYLTLIFRINGRRYIRPYSFSSAPIADSILEVTVKRIENGIVSNHIHDVVTEGDIIEVMEPMGDFVFQASEQTCELYLWGSGSGITPLISIAKQALFEFESVNVNLIYGNRSFEQTIFLGKIQTLMQEYPSRFRVWHFHTRTIFTEKSPYLITGRIDNNAVISVLKEKTNAISQHYICGPLGLKQSVVEGLLSVGIPQQNIHTEDFEIIKDPKDFEDILTRNVKISFKNEDYNIEVPKGKSILESCLDANVELPYSCQTGNCSTCKGKIESGQVRMIGLTKERDDLSNDECLLCCAHPLSDNLNIKIF